MAKRAPSYQFNIPSDYQGTDIYTRAAAIQPAFQDQYSRANANPLLNIVTLGVAGQNAQNERNALTASWNKYLNGLVETQGKADQITGPRNALGAHQARLDYAKQQGQLPTDYPDLYPRSLPPVMDANGNVVNGTQGGGNRNIPFISTEDQKPLMDSLSNALAIDYIKNAYNDQQQRSFNYGSADQGKGSTLNAGVSQTQALPALGLTDAALNNVQQAITSGGNTALSEGNKRFESDRNLPKLLAEIQKLNLEGKETEANIKLKQLQAKFYPQLVTSQIGANNRSGTGGGGGGRPGFQEQLFGMLSPEQRSQYLGNFASGGSPGNQTSAINTINSLSNVLYDKKSSPEAKQNAAMLINQLSPNVGLPGVEAVQDYGYQIGPWRNVGASTTYRPAVGRQAAPIKPAGKSDRRLQGKATEYRTQNGVPVVGLGRGRK